MALPVVEALFVSLREPPTSFTPAGRAKIEVDAVVSRTHTFTARATRFPVEEGADVTDHVRQEPDSLTIDGFVSDHPVVILGGILQGATLSSLVSGAAAQRSRTAVEALLDAKENALLITVVTPLKTYRDMVIERLVVPKTPRTGQAAAFSLELTKIRKASVKQVSIPPGLIDSARRTVKRGRKVAEAVAPASPADRGSSLLLSGLRAMGVFP